MSGNPAWLDIRNFNNFMFWQVYDGMFLIGFGYCGEYKTIKMIEIIGVFG